MNTKKIPFSPPDVGATEAQEVTQALLSGWITTGPRTKEFEREIAAYCHTEKAVCLNSATACMEMILRVLGVGPGDEVITSAYTYTATASVPATSEPKSFWSIRRQAPSKWITTNWPMRSPRRRKS
jgi:dTDP-4-amino-4,6-dideoxygalactose transaminase